VTVLLWNIKRQRNKVEINISTISGKFLKTETSNFREIMSLAAKQVLLLKLSATDVTNKATKG